VGRRQDDSPFLGKVFLEHRLNSQVQGLKLVEEVVVPGIQFRQGYRLLCDSVAHVLHSNRIGKATSLLLAIVKSVAASRSMQPKDGLR